MKINWKVRFKNPMFLAQIVASIFVPILAYMGITVQDLTTWDMVAKALLLAISNPYVLLLVAVSVYNTIIDPTTTGIADSKQALTYLSPSDNKKETTEKLNNREMEDDDNENN